MKKFQSGIAAVAAAGALAVAIGAVLTSNDALAQSGPTAEQAIKYRQGVYKAILWNFGPMAAVVQGKAPYDAQEFTRRAERVAQLAPMLIEGYPPGSDTGATTRAKPAIWQNMAEFRELMSTMEGKASDLAAAARTGDEAKAKAAFGQLGSACKACHDKYRGD